MLNHKDEVHLGKFLSKVLRHQPDLIGISLDGQGWADVDELLEKMQHFGKTLSREDLQQIVNNNNKQRYTFNEDQSRIRANQGHSVRVELGYTPEVPPEFLYHGTATRFLPSILKQGLFKQKRHHVHLSADIETASKVGARHGKLVILTIHTGVMHQDAYEFFLSKNGVWLTEHVPVKYIQLPDES